MPPATEHRRQDPVNGPELKKLVIRPGAIGDVIVSLPALEWLCPNELWAPGPCTSLIRFTQNVRSISSTGLDMVELGGGTEMLREFDEIHSWYGSNRDQFREAVAGLPFVFHPTLPDGTCHATDFYSRHVGAPDGLTPSIPLGRRPEGFIACHPFSGSDAKNWPIENFLALRERLPVQYCAGPEQSLEGAIRMEDLWEIARWLARSNAYVGNDSGITHLAAALGVPVIALFGPTDPAIWAPRGENVQVLKQQGLSTYTLIHALASVSGIDPYGGAQ